MEQKTQIQHFYAAQKRTGEINRHFMELVNANDITSSELRQLIAMRPDIWGRFENWVKILEQKEQSQN